MRTDTTPCLKFPRRTLPIILSLAATAWLAAPPPSRADVIDNYEFSPDTSVTFNDSRSDIISGTFSVDITNFTVENALIVLHGPSPESGIYDTSPYLITEFGKPVIDVNNVSSTATLEITFASPITVSPDTILEVEVQYTTPYFLPSISGLRMGAAVITSQTVTVVPAPIVGAGIPGLLAGVGAFLFWRGRSAMAFVRRRQCSRQKHRAIQDLVFSLFFRKVTTTA